eukprot:4975177-Prymnesium_polylepis.1
MARKLADVLVQRGLPFVVAPFEADAQLAFLVRTGACAAAVSEDSDLLAYGCERTLFKLDLGSGMATQVVFSELRYAEHVSPAAAAPFLFDGVGVDEWSTKWAAGGFAEMCVLAGCDYLPSLHGVGIRSAHGA